MKDHVTEKVVCNRLGFLCYTMSRLNDPLDYPMKQLRICKETGDLTGEGAAYGNIGVAYQLLGQNQKAMEYFMKCLRIFQKTGDLTVEGKVYGNIGAVYKSLGQYEKAMEYHMKDLRICKEAGDLTEEGRAYFNIGVVFQSLGQYENAVEYFMKHAHICVETGDLEGQGMAYNNIGVGYQSLGQYDKAMEYLMKHLRICKETGDLTEEGKGSGNIGNVYQSLGQYENAMEYLTKDLRLCKEASDLTGEGRAHCNIGVVFQSLGQYEKAMECNMKHLHICKETGDLPGQGKAYCNIGVVFQALGQYEKAMEYHMKSLRISKGTGNLTEEGIAYGNIGVVYQSLGQYENAMEYLTKGLLICEEGGNLTGEGKAYGNLGAVYKLLGQYEKAMEYHMKDLRICKEAGDLTGEGKAYGNIGVVYQSLGQYEKAMEYHMKSLLICEETGDLRGERTAYGNIGGVYEALGQHEKALEYVMKGLLICKETGALTGEGKAYGNIGVVYQSLGQYEKAMEYHMKDLHICKETGSLAEEGICYYRIGAAYYRSNDIRGAEGNLKESLRCFQEVFKLLHYQDDYKVSIVDTYIKVYHLLTHVLIASGKEEEALLVSERGRSQALRDKLIMHYGVPKGEEISETLNEGINALVASSDSSFLFLSFSHVVSIFVIEQGKELCLRVRSPGSFAFCAKSDCSTEQFQDDVKSYINNILRDATKYVEAKYKRSCEDRSMNQDQDIKYPDQQLDLDDPISADDVERVATSREEALEDDVITCVASDSRAPIDQIDQDSPVSEPPSKQTQPSQLDFDTTTPESKDEIHSELTLPSSTKVPKEEDGALKEKSTVVNQRNAEQNGEKAFEDLYEALIAPVEEALTKPEIVIIPDGPLFFVPFAALKDKSGHFLSETKRIRVGPSLTTLKLLKECPTEKHGSKGALIVGGPEVGIVMYRGQKTRFGDLPFAREEADMVGDILGAKALTGSLATKDEFKRRLQEGVAIIHIATHSNATTGELVFAPKPSVGKRIPKEKYYMFTVKDIYSSGINAQLVVLSCCHSGRGKIRAEGVVGLTRAFLAAGARSVLASLWAVDDEAAFYFMKSFYQHLKSGESASASLQQAMKEMRKKPEWSHPYYWAPFFIVGDDVRITM